jgi:hypothetical protein
VGATIPNPKRNPENILNSADHIAVTDLIDADIIIVPIFLMPTLLLPTKLMPTFCRDSILYST